MIIESAFVQSPNGPKDSEREKRREKEREREREGGRKREREGGRERK